jgi:hypothetical protein
LRVGDNVGVEWGRGGAVFVEKLVKPVLLFLPVSAAGH